VALAEHARISPPLNSKIESIAEAVGFLVDLILADVAAGNDDL